MLLNKRRNYEETYLSTFARRTVYDRNFDRTDRQGEDFKGGKDFTGKSGSDERNYVDGLLK